MRLGGIQKLTLLDYPGTVACTVFTLGCNMRCPFCHNALLVTKTEEAEVYPEEEFFAFLNKRRGILDGVCVTGGEPLLQSDAGEFIAKIKALGYKVKLDTNGSFPDRLEEILKSGNVDYIAMDIKNSPEKYAETVGIPGFDVSKIQRSIEIIRSSGIEYEFRTTVVAPLHNGESIAGAAQMVKGSPKYFLQNFVDSGNLISGEGMSGLTDEELENALAKAKNFIPQAQIRGEK
ncbi:MAG: anaerobic ribonucleoside-triphosphate reductase activating protein [Oscillospiraceae bacterium]|nr:anaerobic ribonucleoside-triphosphate reductase activating protein [Oscillospiraceae bacterium]